MLNWIFKKSNKHVLTEEERQRGAERTALKWKLEKEKLEREAELDRIKAERDKARYEADLKRLYGENSNNEDAEDDMTPLLSILMASLQNRGVAGSGAVSNTPTTSLLNQVSEPQLLVLSDEQIDELLKQIPKSVLKMVKGLSPQTLRPLIEQKIGNLDDETFSRAVNKLKTV